MPWRVSRSLVKPISSSRCWVQQAGRSARGPQFIQSHSRVSCVHGGRDTLALAISGQSLATVLAALMSPPRAAEAGVKDLSELATAAAGNARRDAPRPAVAGSAVRLEAGSAQREARLVPGPATAADAARGHAGVPAVARHVRLPGAGHTRADVYRTFDDALHCHSRGAPGSTRVAARCTLAGRN